MVNRYLGAVLFVSFLGFLVACTGSKDKKEKTLQKPVISYKNETLYITPLDKEQHNVQISIMGKVVQNKTFTDVYKSSINKIAEGNEYDIALLATDDLRGVGFSLEIKVDDVMDTTIFADITPVEKVSLSSSIAGNCAKLIPSISDPQRIVELRKWLIRRNKHVDDYRLEQMIGVIGKLENDGYTEYVTNDNIPVVKNFVGSSYRVQSDLTADHYVLYAASSDYEIKSFVEEIIANDYDLTVKSLTGALNCYRKMDSDGHKCIVLIGINDDWSYEVVPLGIVAVDNTAPTRSEGKPHNNISFIVLKGNQRVLLPESKPAIDGYANIAIKNCDGNGLSCNVSFMVSFSGDAKSITIVRDKKLSYPWHLSTEKKIISFAGKESPYIFNYDLHFDDGDNIIPIIVEDYHGNTAEYTLTYNARFVRSNAPSIDIYNNNNINVHN